MTWCNTVSWESVGISYVHLKDLFSTQQPQYSYWSGIPYFKIPKTLVSIKLIHHSLCLDVNTLNNWFNVNSFNDLGIVSSSWEVYFQHEIHVSIVSVITAKLKVRLHIFKEFDLLGGSSVRDECNGRMSRREAHSVVCGTKRRTEIMFYEQ